MYSRGVRGAITIEEDNADLLEKAAVELYSKIIEANDIKTEDISRANNINKVSKIIVKATIIII